MSFEAFNATFQRYTADMSPETVSRMPHVASVLSGCVIHLSLLNTGKTMKQAIMAVAILAAGIGAALHSKDFGQTEFTTTMSPLVILFAAPIAIGGLFPLLNYFVHGCIHLFFNKKFTYHRFLGLVYLTQFFSAMYWYWADYSFFSKSHLIWTLPLNGVIQSLTATYYFQFLPKKVDPGYYSDKGALAYDFVKENIFFALILLWQWLYMCDWISPFIPMVFEYAFVFYPYVIRLAFPQTRFRDSMKKSNKTDANYIFFTVVTYITKAFYIWAKHYIGFFLNYARFLNRISDEQVYHIYLMLIWSACATTISMFLHTLAFKHYISKKTSFILYMISYMATFYSWVQMADIFYLNLDLFFVTFVGILINFKSRKWQFGYQALVMVLLTAHRQGMETYILR